MITANADALIRTLKAEGVVLTDENGGGVGVRMKVPDE